MDRSRRHCHPRNRDAKRDVIPRWLVLLAAASLLGAADSTVATLQVPLARSGYEFLSADTQHLQDDDFANPGMLWVDTGRKLWVQADPASGKSCQGCHDQARSMATTAAHYPKYSPAAGRVINLEQQINRCRSGQLKASPWAYESEELLALTAFLSHLSKGIAVEVAVDGNAAESFNRGRQFFYQRRGQLNLSCANCHEQHAGGRLHGETISQGQINGFPIYRQLWQTLGSTHRMFAWCNEAVRAEPYAPGSQEYVDLELYERWRGLGLKVESPAVRR
jgi:L-cysteine S-thiosulfotransferase